MKLHKRPFRATRICQNAEMHRHKPEMLNESKAIIILFVILYYTNINCYLNEPASERRRRRKRRPGRIKKNQRERDSSGVG